MHPPLSAGAGVAPPTKFPKKRGAGGVVTGSQFLERGCWEREGDFQGGCSFYIKNKLKSEIFNDKNVLINKNGFLCHN